MRSLVMDYSPSFRFIVCCISQFAAPNVKILMEEETNFSTFIGLVRYIESVRPR